VAVFAVDIVIELSPTAVLAVKERSDPVVPLPTAIAGVLPVAEATSGQVFASPDCGELIHLDESSVTYLHAGAVS
jgi:hypothetical protein